MNTAITKKKVTLMLDEQVYEGLKVKVGARGIGAYLSKLARPFVVSDNIEAGYKAMAADEARNTEAQEWIEGTMYASNDENIWDFKK